MSNKAGVHTLTAIVQDVLSAVQIPGTSTLGLVVQRVFDKRRDEAIAILIEAIEAGEPLEFEESDAEEFVQMLLRFNRAVQSGAAKQNLRLLAQVIVGLKRNRAFEFDKFQRWSGILENLTRDEMLLIGIASVTAQENPDQFWVRLRQKSEPIYGGCSKLNEIATAITRTGLFVMNVGGDGVSYSHSESLIELGDLARFDRSL